MICKYKTLIMRKFFLCLGALTLLISSCSVSKAARDQRNLISGTWTLNDVSFENNEGTFKAVIFNDADAICFEGSKWFFRDNNSTGKYTIKDGSLCSGGRAFYPMVCSGTRRELQQSAAV